MISNDQELSATLERIRHLQTQVTHLRKAETNPTNYHLSASGFLAEIDRLDRVPSERQADEGIRIALEIVEELREMHGVAGVHFISIKGDESIVRLVGEAGLLPRPAAVGVNPLPQT